MDDNNRCDGVMFRGDNLLPCTRPAHNMTDELLRYCDRCFAVYNESRTRDPEPPYDPAEYGGYVPEGEASTERR